jgi:creatinine amidohydrolase
MREAGMRRAVAQLGLAVVVTGAWAFAQAPKVPAGVSLSDLSWVDAEAVLTPASVVVIPLGAAAVEHGRHLKLNHNERLARYLAERIRATTDVVMAPPLLYSFYPAFMDYPGSTSLTSQTTADVTIEIVRSLARHGPRRFYVLNTGIPTLAPLQIAAARLASEGILLRFTDVRSHLATAGISIQQTPARTTHADEIETSMMLYVDPVAVDMTRAVREYGEGSGPLTRQKGAAGVFSASGVLGDPTLATREKGRALVDALTAGIRGDIEALRRTPAPEPTSPRQWSARAAPARPSTFASQATGCTEGDERAIREIGNRFSTLWRQEDAQGIALLFTPNGDIRHPDGSIERGRNIIMVNRRALFMRRDYSGSVHVLQLNDIRCLGPIYALADGKWELRLNDVSASPPEGRGSSGHVYSGWCTLVVTNSGGSWAIEAWRYTVNPPAGTPLPSTLKQPGFIGRQDR